MILGNGCRMCDPRISYMEKVSQSPFCVVLSQVSILTKMYSHILFTILKIIVFIKFHWLILGCVPICHAIFLCMIIVCPKLSMLKLLFTFFVRPRYGKLSISVPTRNPSLRTRSFKLLPFKK